MFGNNSVTSSWTNPQQNQQQQQQPQGGSAFGQPSGFGTGGAFGSGGAFGQPQQQQQQQQPQANPMFGNLGSSTSTQPAGTSGFGAFGATNPAQNNASNPLFGASKPTTGFGAFGGGGGGTFGGGGAFGSTPSNAASTSGTSGGLFGSSNTNTGTGAFGGGGLFGGNKPATGFGTTAMTTGTANTPFTAFNEKDAANASITLQYQSVTAMPNYRGSSFEELRFQDYQQGRKTAGAFGQSATFGATPQPSTSTGIFGAPAQQTNQPSGSMFGGGGTFGSTNSQPAAGGTFGTGGGAFGQPQPQPSTTGTGTGLFGGGTFGQPQQQQQQQPTTGFGTFGQPQQQQQQPATGTGGGLFGGGAFGAQQNKPATGFGTFGGGTTGGNAFGGGAFGQQNQQGQQQQQPATGGLFGQPQQQPATGGFGTFGSTAPKPGGLFGQPTTQTTTQPTTGFGLFGGNQQQQQQPGQQQQGQQPTTGLFGGGGGLFGGGQQQQQQQPGQPGQQPTGGLFGTQQPQQQSGGLFGGGGGLFGGGTQQQQQPQQQPAQQTGFGLFGVPKVTTPSAPSGGLFGGSTFGQQGTNNNTGTQPNLFGGSLGQQPQQQQGTGTNGFGSGGLFGTKPVAPSLGASQSQGGGLGNSFFGNSLGASSTFNASTANSGAQGSLTASIAQPIGANLPIFSMLPPGPRAVTLEQPKKKPGFFVDVPTRSPIPRLQLGYTPASAKLRGFASQAGASSSGGAGLFTSGKPGALSLSRAADSRASVGPEAFLGRSASPALGSGGRQSVKKLILDKKVEPSDLFSKSGSGSPGALKNSGTGKVTFSPALSVAAREKEAAAAAQPQLLLKGPPTSPATGRGQKAPNRFTAHSTNHILDLGPQPAKGSPAKGTEQTAELQEGDYWVKPDLQTLKNTGYEELSAFKDLVVGRVGYGEIHFLEPVDLTGLPKLGALLGPLVRFDDKECSVYPDADDVDKPPPGAGLNVRARIVLLRCWALDKATREPIKDEKNAAAVKHLKRLRHMRDTHFESFNLEEGKWTFTVDHF